MFLHNLQFDVPFSDESKSTFFFLMSFKKLSVFKQNYIMYVRSFSELTSVSESNHCHCMRDYLNAILTFQNFFDTFHQVLD